MPELPTGTVAFRFTDLEALTAEALTDPRPSPVRIFGDFRPIRRDRPISVVPHVWMVACST
jgi:hypothetical protein